MAQNVNIVFECLPLGRVSHAGMPLDASDEQRALWRRFRAAMNKHGRENTYFLYNADCTFRLSNRNSETNSEFVRFLFEATVRTDAMDERPIEIDLACQLADSDFEQPLAPEVLEFFQEAVRRAVLVEFQHFINAGNLKRTLAQREQLLREWDRNRGFVGMDI